MSDIEFNLRLSPNGELIQRLLDNSQRIAKIIARSEVLTTMKKGTIRCPLRGNRELLEEILDLIQPTLCARAMFVRVLLIDFLKLSE